MPGLPTYAGYINLEINEDVQIEGLFYVSIHYNYYWTRYNKEYVSKLILLSQNDSY